MSSTYSPLISKTGRAEGNVILTSQEHHRPLPNSSTSMHGNIGQRSSSTTGIKLLNDTSMARSQFQTRNPLHLPLNLPGPKQSYDMVELIRQPNIAVYYG